MAVHWGANKVDFGTVVLGGVAIISPYTEWPPSTATVAWTGNDGQSGSVDVEVPESSSGLLSNVHTFCFVLLPDRKVIAGTFTDEEYRNRDADRLSGNGQPLYGVWVHAVDVELRDVEVMFGEHTVFILPSKQPENSPQNRHGWRGSLGLPYVIPEEAAVKWTTPDGVRHEKLVPISLDGPKELEGMALRFEISSNGEVEFSTRLNSEWETWQPE